MNRLEINVSLCLTWSINHPPFVLLKGGTSSMTTEANRHFLWFNQNEKELAFLKKNRSLEHKLGSSQKQKDCHKQTKAAVQNDLSLNEA